MDTVAVDPPPPSSPSPPVLPKACYTTKLVTTDNVYQPTSTLRNPSLIVNCWWLDRSAYDCSAFGYMYEAATVKVLRMCMNHDFNDRRCAQNNTQVWNCLPVGVAMAG